MVQENSINYFMLPIQPHTLTLSNTVSRSLICVNLLVASKSDGPDDTCTYGLYSRLLSELELWLLSWCDIDRVAMYNKNMMPNEQ